MPSKADENKRHLEKTVKIGNFLLKLLNSFRSASRDVSSRDQWKVQDIADVLDIAEVIGGVKAKSLGVDLKVTPAEGPTFFRSSTTWCRTALMRQPWPGSSPVTSPGSTSDASLLMA